MKKIDLPDGLGIRMATPNDKAFIESLFHQSRDAFYIAEQEQDYVRDVIEQQLEIQTAGYGEQTPNAMTFIIDKQDTKIGRVIIDFGHNTAHIVDVLLIREAQGKGYGKAVVQAVQYIAHLQTMPVSLMVEKNNVTAKTLYVSLGFVVEQDMNTHEYMIWYPPQNKVYSGV